MSQNTEHKDLSALTARVIRSSSLSCPVCKYDLSGVQEPRCSECGAALSLQLGHEGDATPRWHLTTLVGLLLLVSASFFQTASSIARTQQGQGTLLWIPPLLLLMLSAGTAVFWVRRERWITRPECMRKVALAACIWAVVAIALIYSTLRANP